MKCKSCSGDMTLASGPHMPKIAIYTCECGTLVKQGLTHDVGVTWILPSGRIETDRVCNLHINDPNCDHRDDDMSGWKFAVVSA